MSRIIDLTGASFYYQTKSHRHVVNCQKQMKITFNDGGVIHVTSAQLREDNLQVLTGHVFNMLTIKSLTYENVPYKDRPKAPTELQNELIRYLQAAYMYEWDKKHSTAAGGVVIKRKSDGDFWFFGMEGEIMHNPEALLTIQL
jgi:hypothetical protein